jgi:NAD(P)-dependent dehydrogenase (short-subunit alcohol dehydrogenase family)
MNETYIMEIKNCTAIITGGASGMGAATARMLAKHGATVALLDVNIDAAKKLAAELNGIAIKCDVTQSESVEAAVAEVTKLPNPLRICINCAGIVHARRMVNKEGTMPLEDFRRVIDINLIGSFNVMRITAAAISNTTPTSSSEERGVIINTASVAAFEGQIGQTAYSASKGGIVAMTLPAARELASVGIRVMTIAPGLVDTPMFEKISPEARAALGAMVPFPKRLANPEEYALLAEQIVLNPMLNGEVIRLDGALRMQPK